MFKVQRRVVFADGRSWVKGKAEGPVWPKAQLTPKEDRAPSAKNLVLSSCSQKIFDFLKRPVITEKATKLIEQKQYTFDVDSQLTKKQIRKIFEYYYGSSIKSIKTHKIGLGTNGRQKPIKRVILCFSKNQEIPIFKNFVHTDLFKKAPLGLEN